MGAQVEDELRAIAASQQVYEGSVHITSAGNSGSIMVRAIAHVVLGFSRQLPRDVRAGELGAAITNCLEQLARNKTFGRVIFTALFNDVRSPLCPTLNHYCTAYSEIQWKTVRYTVYCTLTCKLIYSIRGIEYAV